MSRFSVGGTTWSRRRSAGAAIIRAHDVTATVDAIDVAAAAATIRVGEIDLAVAGGIAMSQNEIVRLEELGLPEADEARLVALTPATYTGLFTPIRELFAGVPLSRERGYNVGRFSFNVTGGRCPTCKGEGSVMVELLFLPSVYTECPDCHGTRYQSSTLEIAWRGRNIAEILAMSVEEAHEATWIDPWFIDQIALINEVADEVRTALGAKLYSEVLDVFATAGVPVTAEPHSGRAGRTG